MKRFFFSLIALSAAAIGCTQSALLETPVTFNQEVSFSPYTGRTPVTKASSIAQPDDQGNMPTGAVTLAASGGFYVYSYLNQESASKSIYINNEHVTNPNGNGWVYDHLVYWPSASTSSLDFVAYSANAWGADYAPDTANTNPKNDNIAWVTDKEGEEFIFTVPDAMESQIDLLATSYQSGYQLGKGGNNGDVELKFHHLLSRVGFKVQTTTSKDVTITGITLAGKMHYQGTLNLLNGAKDAEIPALTVYGTKADKEYSYLTASTTISGANSSAKPVYGNNPRYLMIMPHTAIAAADGLGSDHSILVSYKVGTSDNVNQVSARLPIGFEFVAGKAYEFILKLSTSTLSFDVQEEEWNTDYNNNNNENDDDVPVGPLEPEDESNENPDTGNEVEQSTQTTLTTNGLTLDLGMLTLNSLLAKITVNTSDYDYDFITLSPKRRDIGVRYKESSIGNWQRKSLIQSVETHGEINGESADFTLSLNPGKTYEIAIYLGVSSLGWKGWSDWTYTDFPSTLTFTTPSNFTDFTLQEQAPTPEHYMEGGTNVAKATISHAAIPAQLDGATYISEYGFCWMSGNGTPSKLNNYVSNLTESKVEGNLADGFEYTLELLRPNATYTYCTYVVIPNEVWAYIIPPGQFSAELTLMYPANTILYSTPFTFMVAPIVNNEDNTGTGWGEGGSTDILSENTTEQGNNNNN